MKICLLNENLNPQAGVGRYGREIVKMLAGQPGVEVVVLTEESSSHPLEKAVLKKAFLLRHLLNLFRNTLLVRKYLRDCDIIHALDGYPYGVIAALANLGFNKKLIINGIGTYSVLSLDQPIKKFLMKWAYQKADLVLCISNFTKKQILKRVKPKALVVINHGVDFQKFQAVYQKGDNPPVDGGKIILSVGALKPRKGYDVSLAAVAEVKKHYPDLKYQIVGGPPPQAYLDLVKKHNLENNVEFFQNISDEELIKLYYQADLFLLTPVNINDNDFEGFGLVYLEAGACGKPTVGTYGCGAEDAIINGETGLLVPQKDIQKTTEAILKLLNNTELTQKLGANGKKRAQAMSWDETVSNYIREYEKLLSLK